MKSYRVREKLHDELLQHLLAVRGITEVEEVGRFLAPSFERDSHDPYLLPDMDKAVERILFAARSGEPVCVWSDYDCDGIPGGVMLAEFLRSLGLSVRHYIPHRHHEGYGLNTGGLAELAEQGIKLVITVDLGTTDVEPIAFAKEKGIDVIVTDHHLVPTAEPAHQKSSAAPRLLTGQVLPPAFAVINPKRAGSAYPFDGLCGAGVAWKLVQGLLQKMRGDGQPLDYAQGREKWLLDLVGMATLSDMVPLRGENRMLASFGLVVMRKARRPGLAALLNLLRIKPHTLTEDDIGFMIAPRINAASRMDAPERAARLLATQDPLEAVELAKALQALNDERKGLVASTVKEVNKRLGLGSDAPVIVMGSPSWRPGILGLVANSLAEAHGKPTFLWGREGGELLRGSCRAPGGTNVVDIMAGARDVFEDFGGHSGAGGFAVREGRVHELPARLSASYLQLASDAVSKEVLLDRELDLAEVGFAQRDLLKLSPFGVGNEKPLFIFPNTSIGQVRTFGKANDHLDMALSRLSAMAVSGIAFFSTPDSFSKKVSAGQTADVVGHIEMDWRGKPRIRVVDIV